MEEQELQAEIAALVEPEATIWRGMSDAHKGEMLMLLRRLRENFYFGQSKPPITLDWLIVLNSIYPLSFIRPRINIAYLWLKDNPDRIKKNYRRFISNFMKDNKPQFIYQVAGKE
ncbi:MAG: hypothetical protein PHN44_04200 [Candidatus Marinimicrobia bacterium]|nr:hypothetical protein [Candidatus Neomarinimicrobiota bacterium]MDD5539512.1 hypothetical protein [Candidatus Neomarinimicrobiota bacterium]